MPVRKAGGDSNGLQPAAAATSAAALRLSRRRGRCCAGVPPASRASATAPWQEKQATQADGLRPVVEGVGLQLRREPQQGVVQFPAGHEVTERRLDDESRPPAP